MLKGLTARCLRASILVISVQAFFPGVLPKSEARDLTDVLVQGFSFEVFAPPGLGSAAPASTRLFIGTAVAPALAAAVTQAVTQEFPLASVAPAFTYRFNPALDIFERWTGVPGPLFSERALTVGKGQFNFGVGYSFIDFSDLNGTDLDNIRSPTIFPEIFPEIFDEESLPLGQLPSGDSVFFAPVSGTVIRTRIDLQAHVIVPTLRYGITNNWDVGLSIPIVNTFLRARNEAVRLVDIDFPSTGFVFTRDAQGNLRETLGFAVGPEVSFVSPFEVPFVKSQRSAESLSRGAGSATGVGDLTLRSKYHLWRSEFGGAALGLNLQLPSGEVRDFHGTDETHLSTFLYLSQVLWERFEPHLNLGVDFNTDEVDRSGFLYAVGGSLQVGTKLGVVVDFIGRSEFGAIPVRIPPEGVVPAGVLGRAPGTCTAERPCFLDPDREVVFRPLFSEKIKRNDVVNFSFGLRYVLGTSGSIFFGGIVPLNDDGFRADFISSGGITTLFKKRQIGTEKGGTGLP